MRMRERHGSRWTRRRLGWLAAGAGAGAGGVVGSACSAGGGALPGRGGPQGRDPAVLEPLRGADPGR